MRPTSSEGGPSACPDENVLAGLASGARGAVAPSLARHLEDCPPCRALLGVLAAEDSGAGSSHVPTRLETGEPTLPETPAAPALSAGHRLGRYVVEEPLGQGGMGMVYSARDPALGRTVALKLLRPGLGGAEARARLVREARAMARLAHPNVLPLFELGTEDEQVFLAMERIEGPTLAAWLAERERPWREVLTLLLQAGEGLAAAHRAGLVHRDFKPGNVLVGADGRPRVTDFGLVCASGEDGGAGTPEPDGRLTQTGAAPGTPPYMSPEQHAGRAVDARGDQFSFCVTLYEALHGVRPFDSRAREVGARWLRVKPVRDPHLPRAVRRALDRGLSPRPEERFSSMDALLAALRLALLPRRGAWAMGLAGLALVLTGAGVLGARLRAPEDAPPKTVPISLRMGGTVELGVPGMTRVAIGDSHIADVEILGQDRMRLLPRAEGKTTLLVWSPGGLTREYLLSVHPP